MLKSRRSYFWRRDGENVIIVYKYGADLKSPGGEWRSLHAETAKEIAEVLNTPIKPYDCQNCDEMPDKYFVDGVIWRSYESAFKNRRE